MSKETLESVLKSRGPELTAYALGELTEMEMDALKKEFKNNPEVMAYLSEMEELGGMLADTVPQKVAHSLTEEQKQSVLSARPKETKSILDYFRPKLFMPAFGAVTVALLIFVLLPKTQTPDGEILPDVLMETDPFDDYYEFDATSNSDMDESEDAVQPAEINEGYTYEGQTSAVAPKVESPKKMAASPVANKPGRIQQGGSAKVESQTKDPSKTGLFSTFGSGGRDKSYSGSGQLAGLSDSATGASGFAEESNSSGQGKSNFGVSGVGAAKGLGSKLKEVDGGAGRKHYENPHVYNGLYNSQTTSGDDYLQLIENIFQSVKQEPLSTFSIDVDTSAYSQVRTQLINSQLPPDGLVRAEEFINYFGYNYEKPSGGKPFSVNVEVTQAPWNEKHHLVRIGLLGEKTPESKRKANNFVFLVDVSGSMEDENKLPLVKSSLKMLAKNLRAEDRVAIVTYAGSTEVVLESTSGSKKQKIIDAIDSLNSGGSTDGESGIQMAYKIAIQNKLSEGNNRVVLATDGDFNVGVTDENSLEEMIEKKAKSSGVFLTVLGYGMGNYKDSRMQKLANKGNGNNFYIDSQREARKVLIEQAGGTLNAIAKDVKIQVEFHPKYVQSYRLIGYEKRKLNAEDFNDDQKDAGEIGEGHTVTALYEVIPVGVVGSPGTVDPLKYQENKAVPTAGPSDELLTVKLRYKKPKSNTSELIEVPVKNVVTPIAKASSDTKFAAAVAGYTMVLRDSKHKGNYDLNKAQELAASNMTVNGKKDQYRAEFVELIKKTRSLKATPKEKPSRPQYKGGSENFGGDDVVE